MKLLTELVDIICWMTLCMSGWLVMAAINPPPPAPHKQQPENIFGRKCKMFHSHMSHTHTLSHTLPKHLLMVNSTAQQGRQCAIKVLKRALPANV